MVYKIYMNSAIGIVQFSYGIRSHYKNCVKKYILILYGMHNKQRKFAIYIEILKWKIEMLEGNGFLMCH